MTYGSYESESYISVVDEDSGLLGFNAVYNVCEVRRGHCVTSHKVTGSIPDGVTGIFHWYYPSGRTMSLGLTQPLTEMSTRSIFWGVKAAGAEG